MEERAWYSVQTYSGMEKAVKKNIERRIESMGMQEYIFNVLVPEEVRYEKKKNGELKEVVEKPFSGYFFVDMIVTDETWFMVRNTPMVTGFLGSSGGGAKPVPLHNDEILPVLKMCGINTNKTLNCKPGDKCKVMSGNFIGQECVIDSIDEPKQQVKVLIEVFGRQVTLELGFNDIKVL